MEIHHETDREGPKFVKTVMTLQFSGGLSQKGMEKKRENAP